jgi:hypothetical protein
MCTPFPLEDLPVNSPIQTIDRASLISSILTQRKPMQERLDQTYTELQALQAALTQTETQRGQLLAHVELDDVKDGLQGIDFRQTGARIEQELKALEKLRQRFGRETLNIGVIGRARQGKSRLLQSLTGLTSQEIPDGDGKHCTGVKSNIIRHTGETTATVIFHDARSFLEKIAVYYKVLGLGDCPSTIENFAASPLVPLPSAKSTEADAEKYRHLEKYKDNLATYRPLIGQGPKAIKADEIRQYVAQDTVDGKRIYSSYLVVKEVLIYCDFPNPDVGQISVIDMPGLGDTGIGDKERMIETLGESVDFVLFVKKPHNANLEDSDVNLYDTASAALVDLPIKQWSFMVLNRTEDPTMGDNLRYCKMLHETIEEKSIHSQTIVANCSKSDEVNDLILDPLLNYMLASIERLDRQYAQTCQQRVNAIHAEVETIVTTANNVIAQLPNDDDTNVFADRFDDFWKSLAASLDEMLNRLKSTRKQQDPDFKTAVYQVLDECGERPNLPTLEDIEEVQKGLGDWAGTQGQLMHETRNQLSKAFSEIEVGLKPCIDEVKREIYQVLEQENLGKLALNLKDAAYLQQVALKIPQDCPDLKLAFDQLSNFELLYRGFIQHRIRKHLDALTPDLTLHRYDPYQQLQTTNNWGIVVKTVPIDKAPQVKLNLEKAHRDALAGCHKELKKLLDEPSLAAFAIAEEFTDRILHAKDTRKEFRRFLSKYRKDVWPETFNQSEQFRTVALKWKTAVNGLEPFQRKTRYQFS